MGPGLLYACPGRRPREEGAAGVGRLLLLLLAVPPPIHHCRWSCLCLCQGSPVPSLPLHPGEIPGEHQHLKESQLPFFQIRQGAPSQPSFVSLFLHKTSKAFTSPSVYRGVGGDGNVSLTQSRCCQHRGRSASQNPPAPIKR